MCEALADRNYLRRIADGYTLSGELAKAMGIKVAQGVAAAQNN